MSTLVTLTKQSIIKEEMQKYTSEGPMEEKVLTKRWVSPNRIFQAPQHLSSWYSVKSTKQTTEVCVGGPLLTVHPLWLNALVSVVSAAAGRIMALGP